VCLIQPAASTPKEAPGQSRHREGSQDQAGARAPPGNTPADCRPRNGHRRRVCGGLSHGSHRLHTNDDGWGCSRWQRRRCCIRQGLDRRNEAIPLARHRLDERRRVRCIAERLPKLADRGVYTVLDVDEHILGPKRVHDLIPRDELTSSAHEENQKIHWLPLEADAMSVAAQLIRSDVKHEVANAKRPAVSRERHLLVALRSHNSSGCHVLEKQIIDRPSRAPLHGQVRRDQAGLAAFSVQSGAGNRQEGRVCHDVDRFDSTFRGSQRGNTGPDDDSIGGQCRKH
jgi:hypothetical protein